MELIVNMEKGYQTLLKSMQTTSKMVDQMVQLRLGTDSKKGLEKKQSIDGSLNLSAGRETQTQL